MNKLARLFPLFVLGSIIVVSTAGGCSTTGDSSSEAPPGAPGATASTEDYDAVADMVAGVALDTQHGEISLTGVVVASLDGKAPLGFKVNASGQVVSAGLGADVVVGLTCQDSTSQTVACASPSVDAVTGDSKVTGGVKAIRWSGSIAQSGQFAVKGITQGPWQVTGSNTITLSADASGLLFKGSWDLQYSSSYQGVTVDPKTGAPQSGTIAYTISADRVVRSAGRNVDASFKMNAVLTFAPGQASLVIDGSHSYRLDASGNVTP